MNIDLIYLWVDGSDLGWARKKTSYEVRCNVPEKDSATEERYYNNDELKYSLRSVETYAPWINKIFIVTDNQIPVWLNTDNPKLRIVDHREFIPEDVLPLFSSVAIEAWLPFVPGLSEHFLYANDDMFFGNTVNPDDFFISDDVFIVRMRNHFLKNPYQELVKTIADPQTNLIQKRESLTKKLFLDRFGILYNYDLHHGIDAYTKSAYLQAINEFGDEFSLAGRSKFRQETDIRRTIIYFLALMHGKAKLKVLNIGKKVPKYKRLCNKILGKANYETYFTITGENKHLEIIKKERPKLFCINDHANNKSEDRLRIKKFLESYFPSKSSYEKN